MSSSLRKARKIILDFKRRDLEQRLQGSWIMDLWSLGLLDHTSILMFHRQECVFLWQCLMFMFRYLNPASVRQSDTSHWMTSNPFGTIPNLDDCECLGPKPFTRQGVRDLNRNRNR